LKSAFGDYPHTKALKNGTVTIPGVTLDHQPVSGPGGILTVFRQMSRDVSFDVAEMAITTWLTAKAYNKPFTAIPVFVVRQPWHGATVVNTNVVKSPKDLEGKKVGVRAYTVTGGVWCRGILAEQYGVDLSNVTWVLADEEHVDDFHKDYPGNVERRIGADLGALIASGELAGGVGMGRVDSPDVKPLIANAAQAATDWYKNEGIFPINHTVVVKNSVLESDPTIAERLFNGFNQAKEAFLKQLDAGGELSDEAKEFAARRDYMGRDPLPYGIEPNRKALETIIRYAHQQGILPRNYAPEEVFARGTETLR
jgi:4,5-dihydroxyphthalate decarboxylase